MLVLEAKMSEYYIVEWQHSEKGWMKSTLGPKPTKEEAEEQLKRDIGYFYNNIEIRLVKVTEEVVKTVKGSQERPTHGR